MSLKDAIKGELIEIIEWTDDSRDTLSYRYPDNDKAIKRGDQLIVRESKALGVNEADVIASLESGDLKGKRIGSQWRLTREQLAQFLQ